MRCGAPWSQKLAAFHGAVHRASEMSRCGAVLFQNVTVRCTLQTLFVTARFGVTRSNNRGAPWGTTAVLNG